MDMRFYVGRIKWSVLKSLTNIDDLSADRNSLEVGMIFFEVAGGPYGAEPVVRKGPAPWPATCAFDLWQRYLNL